MEKVKKSGIFVDQDRWTLCLVKGLCQTIADDHLLAAGLDIGAVGRTINGVVPEDAIYNGGNAGPRGLKSDRLVIDDGAIGKAGG